MNNVNGGVDSIGTMFPLSEEDVVIEYRKAAWHVFTLFISTIIIRVYITGSYKLHFFFTLQYIFQLLFTHRIKPALLMFTDFILLQYAI